MLIGDYLLKKNKITQKQREKAELEHELTGHKFGRCCVDLKYITRTDLNQALKALKRSEEKGNKPMAPTEIGEGSKFTFDLKFIATLAAILVSASATYFSITGQVEDNADEIANIKSMGDLKIISYKLGEYDETFKDLKDLNRTLSPLASDLTYIKEELDKLKNKKIQIPEVDLSGIDECKNKLDALNAKIDAFESRLAKLEKKSGGRF